jgi:transcriptional regulator with XRE-family HTH domain
MEQEFYKDLIAHLVAHRHAIGLSQEQLCEKLGVSDGLVNKWESGVRMPSSFYLMCWCIALELTLVPTEITHGQTDKHQARQASLRLNG